MVSHVDLTICNSGPAIKIADDSGRTIQIEGNANISYKHYAQNQEQIVSAWNGNIESYNPYDRDETTQSNAVLNFRKSSHQNAFMAIVGENNTLELSDLNESRIKALEKQYKFTLKNFNAKEQSATIDFNDGTKMTIDFDIPPQTTKSSNEPGTIETVGNFLGDCVGFFGKLFIEIGDGFTKTIGWSTGHCDKNGN